MNTTKPEVTAFYDEQTGSLQYVVADPVTGSCAIIDPVLDFDDRSGSTSTANADLLLGFIEQQQLALEWILDTHPHADHFSASAYLRTRTGVPIGIGDRIVDVQNFWKDIYNWPDLPADGSQWDRLFEDGATFWIGMLPVKVMHSPGHTSASITYMVGDSVFVHDTLLMPDSGTARCDFPGASASLLWNSIQKIFALSDETRVFVGHDDRHDGREPKWESTVAEQRATNIHVRDCRTEAEFVTMRETLDRALPMPRRILHALQININGGQLPPPEVNGKQYLKFPLNSFNDAVGDGRGRRLPAAPC